ncbi:MAG: hypothetical protein ACJASU_002346, partial [Cognaticolwellia sp.]
LSVLVTILLTIIKDIFIEAIDTITRKSLLKK